MKNQRWEILFALLFLPALALVGWGVALLLALIRAPVP